MRGAAKPYDTIATASLVKGDIRDCTSLINIMNSKILYP